MSAFPRMWNDETKMMERICTHGLTHTDDLQYEFFVMTVGPARAARITQHDDCDGCCHPYIDGEIVVSEIENPRKEIGS